MLSWATVFGAPAQVALVFYKAVGPAMLGSLLGYYRPRNAFLGALFSACAWITMEYYQLLGPLGMTWGMLSHTQARELILIQISELTGPWGLSFVLAFWNASLAELLWHRQRALLTFGVALGLVAVTLAFGYARLGHTWGDGPPLRWAVVQTSMEQNHRWDPNFREEIMGRLARLTHSASMEGADIVLWPETSVPYPFFLDTEPLRERVSRMALGNGTYILVGSIERGSDAHTTRNVSTLIGPDGSFLEQFQKIRLVPFGEYLPLPTFMREWAVFDRVMRYEPGEKQVLFPRPTPFGVLICYESMVPQEPLHKVEIGAGVLAVVTNDAWFGKSSAAMHHFEMAIMRAVEMRRPVVQCGNNGISGFIEPSGRVVAETQLDEIVQLTREVVPETYRTFYSRYGDLVAYFCLACLLALLAWQIRRRDA